MRRHRTAASWGFACLCMVTLLLQSTIVAAQNDETRGDERILSGLITRETGIPTVVRVIPGKAGRFDVHVAFNGTIANYQGVMGIMIGAVAQTTREARYRSEWCYITTRERGPERITTEALRTSQKLAYAGDSDGAWQQFVSHLGSLSEVSSPSNAPATATQAPKNAPIVRLEQLETSAFARLYDVKKSHGWNLRSGEFNQSYTVQRLPDVTLEAQTRKNQIAGLGLIFIGHASLTDRDRIFIHDILQDLEPGASLAQDLLAYIASAGDRRVFQILQVRPVRFGGFQVYAGSVGGDVTISFKRN